MILVTHAVVGASAASVVAGYPVMGFVAGFVSHFLLDAIPHWDYKLRSDFINPEKNKSFCWSSDFFVDAFKIGFDIAGGFFLAFLIFYSNVSKEVIFLGVVGGILPDILQFVAVKMPWKPFVLLRRFHKNIQKDRRLENRAVIGFSLQCLIILAVYILTM